MKIPLSCIVFFMVLVSGCATFNLELNSSDIADLTENRTQEITNTSQGNLNASQESWKPLNGSAIIADHAIVNKVRLKQVPESAITLAKEKLHIAYQHTSHGSQIVSGMNGLSDFMESKGASEGLYAWNDGPKNGSLDLDDLGMGSYAGSASDLGYTDWAEATRNYLNDQKNSDVNVIMWSWCGQVGSYGEQGLIDHYLGPMSQLEAEFPNVIFVYMTGHVDGNGLEGDVHKANEQIREYVKANGKVLYDFADIESYDPDGDYFGDKNVNDNCNYAGGNWCEEWQAANPAEWYSCSAAHSKPLNGNMKAYAAWWLFAQLAERV